MKRIEEPVEVEDRKGWPVRIRRGARDYRVRELVDVWIVQGRWWLDEEKRVYFRVLTDKGVMDVYRRDPKGEWIMSKLAD
jgi:hypothetical protein